MTQNKFLPLSFHEKAIWLAHDGYNQDKNALNSKSKSSNHFHMKDLQVFEYITGSSYHQMLTQKLPQKVTLKNQEFWDFLTHL